MTKAKRVRKPNAFTVGGKQFAYVMPPTDGIAKRVILNSEPFASDFGLIRVLERDADRLARWLTRAAAWCRDEKISGGEKA